MVSGGPLHSKWTVSGLVHYSDDEGQNKSVQWAELYAVSLAMMGELNNCESPRIWVFTDLQALATCIWQVRLMLVNLAGGGLWYRWVLRGRDRYSGLGVTYSLVDIHAQGAIQGLARKIPAIHRLSGHPSSDQGTHFIAHNIQQWTEGCDFQRNGLEDNWNR